MKVAVVDHGSGNLASVERGLLKAAERTKREVEVTVTSAPDRIAHADRIVLPGQGAFAASASGIKSTTGMWEALQSATVNGVPLLGICVGMQIMAQRGLEHAITRGFGWLEGDVVEISAGGLRLPQMGWNTLDFTPGAHPLLAGLMPGDHAYFVHSFGLMPSTAGSVIATTDYGGPVTAMVAQGNRAGTQFHVEKSQEVGLQILSNFLDWNP